MQKEQANRKMRFEWRKNLEDGYQNEMEETKKRTRDELKELRNGPTTIGALGNHYQH